MTPAPPGMTAGWDSVPQGKRLLLAFVKVDRKGSAEEWHDMPESAVLERSARYTAGVEEIAKQFRSAPPNWQGDGVTLFLKDDDGPAPVRAFQAAKMLWQRIRVDLNLPTRIAVHAAEVPWNVDTGKIHHPALDSCGHLEQVTPVNAIAVTEDVYLTLPGTERGELARLGITTRDGTPAYVYPASGGRHRDGGAFIESDDLDLWDAFRRYATSAEIRRLRYVGLRLVKKEPPSLDVTDVFVPPDVQRWPCERGAPEALARRTRRQADARGRGAVADVPWRTLAERESAGAAEPFREAFARSRHIIVLGDPGSGKTTLLRWLAVAAAGGRLGAWRELGVTERLLPVPVSIGRLAETRRSMGMSGSVIDALALYFHARNVGPSAERVAPFLQARVRDGECLFLLDGLDEVKGSDREELRHWLETFVASAAANRFVVSSRIVGYPSFEMPDSTESVLRPFNDEQVRAYLDAFHVAYRRWEDDVGDDVAAKRQAGELADALKDSPRLRALARNPFLLSCLALIHRAEGTLPAHRVKAYEIIARALCETWETARRLVATSRGPEIPFEEEAIPILGELALRMHEDWPTGIAPKRFVLDTLANALQQRKSVSVDQAQKVAREFLLRAGEEVQLLVERGAGEWGFLHLTFQEYFAAAGLHASEDFEKAASKHLFSPRWQEVIRLGIGYMALVQKRPEAAARFIEKVLRLQKRGKRAWITNVLKMQIPLAALLAAEAGDALPAELQLRIAREFVEWGLGVGAPLAERFLNEIALMDFRHRMADAYLNAMNDKEASRRRLAAQALGALRAEAAVDLLISALGDPEPSVRRGAVCALGELKSESATLRVIDMLNDEDAQVAMEAIEALGRIGTAMARDALLSLARDEQEDQVFRDLAVRALDGLVSAELLDTLQDDVMAWFEGSLAESSTEQETPSGTGTRIIAPPPTDPKALAQRLKDQDPTVRWLAARKLGLITEESAIEPLLSTLVDKVERVRHSATVALWRIAQAMDDRPRRKRGRQKKGA